MGVSFALNLEPEGVCKDKSLKLMGKFCKMGEKGGKKRKLNQRLSQRKKWSRVYPWYRVCSLQGKARYLKCKCNSLCIVRTLCQLLKTMKLLLWSAKL